MQELQTSQAMIEKLSAPVLPIASNVLLTPLIGTITRDRASNITLNVLRAVEQMSTRYVVFDITGVPFVDTQVAHVLIQTATALQR